MGAPGQTFAISVAHVQPRESPERILTPAFNVAGLGIPGVTVGFCDLNYGYFVQGTSWRCKTCNAARIAMKLSPMI